MFPTFISILDIQSWWEVPSIAHFCSLFRTAFNLLDFDIEDLEEALLTDGTEETSWLQELIVRLLSGCLPNNEISTFNYQMFLRRLFRQKCQEHDRYNPFNTDIDFQLLPLRTKVDILHSLCDFRLDADDVLEQLKNLEADSLRVEPLGYDSNDSAYWYFYGTRLYREDFKTKNNKKKSIWQVICFTEDDWFQLTKKFKKSTSKVEKQLHHTLSENFLPELPRLFKEKERLARKRLLENQPRRTSNRLRKVENEVEKEEKKEEQQEDTLIDQELKDEKQRKRDLEKKRREAYERRAKLKEQSEDSHSEVSECRYEMAGAKTRGKKPKGRQRKQSECSTSSKDTVSAKTAKRNKSTNQSSTKTSNTQPTTVGRQTNNSLAAATGQIVIQSVSNPAKKKLKTSQVFRQTDEDLQTGMHKILDYVKNHEDAWPFADPVDEDYAPNYYSVIRKPMDLQRIEERLDAGSYKTYSKFKADFQLIVDNCRLYNGAENEYTEMVDNLLKVFERATEKYLDQISSSDDEIAVENLESESDSKSNKKKKNDGITTTKRKPMLAAQTDKKRERSLSEESLTRSDSFDCLVKLENEKPSKVKKQTDKSVKKQSKSSKVMKGKSKKEKQESKKVSKEKSTKSKKLNKKEKNRSPVRSRSSSRSLSKSPPPSHCSSPPPSWPPSSPDSRFDFSPKKKSLKRHSEFSEDEENFKGKQKHKEDRIKDLFDDERILPIEKKMKKEKSPPPSPKPKDKHNKLRETIEKLKAKSEISNKIKNSEYDFDLEDNPKENKESLKKVEKEDKLKSKPKEKPNKQSKKDVDFDDGNSTMDSMLSESKKSTKKPPAKTNTANSNKNAASIDALTLATEQTLKDINKWLDDTPKYSEFSSASNSPSYTGLDEFDALSGKIEPDNRKKSEKVPLKKDSLGKDIKRRPFRDPAKFFKRREVQRTIDRLQPGKSKGNLISNVQPTNKVDEIFPLGPLSKIKDTKNSLIVKTDTNAPKLSLGSVLDSFGKHKFVDDQKKEEIKPETQTEETSTVSVSKDVKENEEELKEDQNLKIEVKEDVKNDVEEISSNAIGGATPNLSAWFKAFGAPKIQPTLKKPDLKPDGKENEKTEENCKSSNDSKLKDDSRKVSPPDPSPNPDSPIHSQPIPRQRKISTGSSMSERSSFSQDMDSPRVGIDERLGAYPAPYPSPLHRSPSGASPVMASPRPDVSPRAAAYPTFNGQIRVGFYQDTVSNKSSPDKSCSPRDNPQSPYTQISEHVYTPNTTQSAIYSYANSPYYTHTPNYSSTNPTPPYTMEANPPSYYDTSKSLTEQYQVRPVQNYTANSPASNVSSPVPQPQQSPSIDNFQQQEEQPKVTEKLCNQSAIFPVKKRAYNESESSHLNINRYEMDSRGSPQDILSKNLHAGEQINLNVSNPPDQVVSRQEVKEDIKQYIQNIPDPKQILQQVETFNKPTSNVSPVPQHPQTATPQQQTHQTISDTSNMRNTNYSAASAQNQFNTYNNESGYSLNVPSARNISNTQEMERKIEMSKYTNMGYTGPDVSFSRNLQQYSRPEINYSHPTISSSGQQTQQSSVPNNPPITQANDMTALRYRNSLQTGFSKDLDLTNAMPNTQQAHSNYTNNSVHQNTRPPTENVSSRLSQNQETAGNYKSSEVSIPRPTYNAPSLEIDQSLGLRGNMANLSHIVDRFNNDERMLQGLQSSAASSFYSDKGLAASHMFNKPISTSASALPMFSQASMGMQSFNQNMQATSTSMYNRQMADLQTSALMSNDHKTAPVVTQEKKSKKRKSSKPVAPTNPVDNQQSGNQGFQSYAGLKSSSSIEPSAISLKTTSVVPGSAFNFGPTPTGLSIGSGLYGDKDAYPNFLEEFRSPSNYYMAAAAAHHRSTPESTEKPTRVAHQSSTPQSPGYPFLGAPQARPSYPFMPPAQAQLMDASSPLYQHYLQAGVLNQGLLPPPGAYTPGYHPALSMRQPYDSMTRPPWL